MEIKNIEEVLSSKTRCNFDISEWQIELENQIKMTECVLKYMKGTESCITKLEDDKKLLRAIERKKIELYFQRMGIKNYE